MTIKAEVLPAEGILKGRAKSIRQQLMGSEGHHENDAGGGKKKGSKQRT